MIKRVLNKQINSIGIAALLIALSSLASRFLGVFRDRILAGTFGAGDTLDVYYAAFKIPDLIYNLLVLGALSAGFIPVFTKLLKNPLAKAKGFILGEENKDAWELASISLNILGIFLLALSIIGMIFAPQFTKLITPGFSADKQAQTAALTRIMFLSPLFLGLSSIFGGILQSCKRFFIYSLSPIVYNLGIIFGALWLIKPFGIYGLAWGVVIGSFLHMIVQLPAVISMGFRYSPMIKIIKEIKEIGIMMVPRAMSLAITQINLTVITIIASTLAGGSLAIFNFANNLQSFPVGIFGISFAIASFPTLSAVAFNKKKLVENFSGSLRQILFFIVPSTVLLLTLRAQIIRVVLGSGKFDWEDTVLTMNTLGFFALSLFSQSIIPLLTRVFYARHNSKTPFIIGLCTATVNVVLALLLKKKFGVAGLALAFSIDNILNFLALWAVLHWEIGDMDETRILISTVKFSSAAIVCGLAVQSAKLIIEPFVNMDKFWGIFTQGFLAGIIGIAVYLAICVLLRSEELFSFWSSVKRRLPFKKIETCDQSEARGI